MSGALTRAEQLALVPDSTGRSWWLDLHGLVAGSAGGPAHVLCLQPHPQVLSLMFSACTRLRRIFLLLPDALGKTQPDCLALVLDHFARGPRWDLTALTSVGFSEVKVGRVAILAPCKRATVAPHGPELAGRLAGPLAES